jgi:hypothetical protein
MITRSCRRGWVWLLFVFLILFDDMVDNLLLSCACRCFCWMERMIQGRILYSVRYRIRVSRRRVVLGQYCLTYFHCYQTSHIYELFLQKPSISGYGKP